MKPSPSAFSRCWAPWTPEIEVGASSEARRASSPESSPEGIQDFSHEAAAPAAAVAAAPAAATDEATDEAVGSSSERRPNQCDPATSRLTRGGGFLGYLIA